jgi:hypothetical protein
VFDVELIYMNTWKNHIKGAVCNFESNILRQLKKVASGKAGIPLYKNTTNNLDI